MGDLSRNFDSSEFACNCGCGLDSVDPALLYALQALRDTVGKPMIITSGCRCASHNINIGGSKASYHLLGKAADFTIPGLTTREMLDAAMGIPHIRGGGVGYYPESHFIHIDTRRYKARWSRIKGEYYPGVVEPDKFEQLKKDGVV
jgi:uncharacterized protein YcbK (DUF882 family)